MFKRRQFKKVYFIIMGLVLALSIWLNVQSLQMETITCHASNAVCEQVGHYLEYSYFAYASIIFFALMILYYYIFNVKNDVLVEEKEENVSATIEHSFKIDFEKESAREYKNKIIDKE